MYQHERCTTSCAPTQTSKTPALFDSLLDSPIFLSNFYPIYHSNWEKGGKEERRIENFRIRRSRYDRWTSWTFSKSGTMKGGGDKRPTSAIYIGDHIRSRGINRGDETRARRQVKQSVRSIPTSQPVYFERTPLSLLCSSPLDSANLFFPPRKESWRGNSDRNLQQRVHLA